MQIITAYKTADGSIYEAESAAKRHADKVYGARLTELAHRISRLDGKYSEILKFLDESGVEFSILAAARVDMVVHDQRD